MSKKCHTIITKIINFYTEFIVLLTGVNWLHGNRKCSMNGKKSSKRGQNHSNLCLGSIFLSWHIFSPWQSCLHPFLHVPDKRHFCMKAKKKFTWQWIFPLNVSVQKWLVLACLTEARGDPTRSSSSPSPSRSTAAREPLKYSPIRPSELLELQVVSAINGDDVDNEWRWWHWQNAYFGAFT